MLTIGSKGQGQHMCEGAYNICTTRIYISTIGNKWEALNALLEQSTKGPLAQAQHPCPQTD
jgi:hypothetical protein